MTTTTLLLNMVFAALTAGVIAAAYRIAHNRLPAHSPLSDERWGTGGDPWVPSAPLPLHQIARHEDDRADAVAA